MGFILSNYMTLIHSMVYGAYMELVEGAHQFVIVGDQ